MMYSKNAPLPRAALAAEPDPMTSARYVHVDTRAVVRAMEKDGWVVAGATASQPRKRDPLYARHVIDFRRPEFPEIHGAVPRVLFTNSHNGTTAARALAGFFRFVCSNGLVAGTLTGQFSCRHSGYGPTELVHEMNQLGDVALAHSETLARWNEKELTAHQREVYAQLVAQLRWGDAYAYAPDQVLRVRRAEDDAGTLFATFNKAQENTIRGGLSGISRSGRAATSRPLTDIGRDLEYNTRLWRMTQELYDFW